MRIGVVGGGVVGQATARCWLEHCDEVVVWDRLKERCTHGDGDTGLLRALSCDLVFVCLPEAELDRFFSGEAVRGLPAVNYAIRSTIPIGTTRRLMKQYGLQNLVHSPEFLTARCATTNAQLPARNIVGDAAPLERLQGGYYYSQLATYLGTHYKRRFPGIPCRVMSSDESEAVKLITNAFFAVKVAYFNEARSLCDALKLDWATVLAGVLSDGRIAHSHTKVPGPDGKCGFGGACLPKDLAMLADCITGVGLDTCVPIMCEAAETRNKVDRRE